MSTMPEKIKRRYSPKLVKIGCRYLSIYPSIYLSSQSIFRFVLCTFNSFLFPKSPTLLITFNHHQQHQRRLLASVPPTIMAAVLGKLDQIFAFTGLFAFFLELIFPALLQLLSSRYCKREFGVSIHIMNVLAR